MPDVIPEALIDVLADAARVTVLTGSGVSAESGVPTFRDAQTGLWEDYRPEDLATPEAFRRQPELVWNWYLWRRQLVREARPNPAHLALAELESLVDDFALITQNVDGLHQRAGSQSVVEFHGNILRTRCFVEDRVVDTSQGDEVPPRCPYCSGPLRPDVVWFGEAIPARALEAAFEATERCQVFFAVGTSAVVQPAASLATLAARSGARIVEINPEHTPLSGSADFMIRGAAGEVLPVLLSQLKARRSQAG